MSDRKIVVMIFCITVPLFLLFCFVYQRCNRTTLSGQASVADTTQTPTRTAETPHQNIGSNSSRSAEGAGGLEGRIAELQAENKRIASEARVRIAELEAENKRLASEREVKAASDKGPTTAQSPGPSTVGRPGVAGYGPRPTMGMTEKELLSLPGYMVLTAETTTTHTYFVVQPYYTGKGEEWLNSDKQFQVTVRDGKVVSIALR